MSRLLTFSLAAVSLSILSTLDAAELRTDFSPGRHALHLADSPVHVPTTIHVPDGAIVSIEAGVELRFGSGACLVVEGELHALGEKHSPVRFLPDEGVERWGNLKIMGDKDLPSYDGDRIYIPDSGGSRLQFCEFSGAGLVPDEEYDGGALYLNGSAPIVRDCTFQNNRAERGGALVCYNFSTPLIQSCTFEGNASLLDDGGAIYCFFYSDALIERNFIVGNESARHGGGLYVSVSNPLIRENAFIDNRATRWGGAMYVSSSSPQILDNAFFEHRAEERSTGITLQSDCQPVIRGNSLQTGGVEVLGLNLSYDLDLSGNWWGTTDEFIVLGKTEQRGRGRDRKLTIDPWLDRPVNNLLTQPVEIQSLHVMTTSDWSDTLAFDLVDGVLARLQINAVDRNPYAIDQTSARVSVLERPDVSHTLIFRESEKASGIFRARLSVNRDSDDHPSIDVSVGEHLLFSSSADERVTRLYRVDEARPVVHDLAILSDPDPTHLIEHQLKVSWKYFDLLGRQQNSVQMQVATDESFAGDFIWDSGPRDAEPALSQLVYGGRPLEDGARYFVRMRSKGETAWSAWQTFMVRSDNPEFSVRMNSLPELPRLVSPDAGAILPVYKPELKVQAVSDREGDRVGYHFQLAADQWFQRVIAESDASLLAEPVWTPLEDLEDNGRYWWRVRVWDGFEWADWTGSRELALNPVEEAPLPLTLIAPSGDIADVLPEFKWHAAVDPDPGARLSYTFLIGKKQDLSDAERVPFIEDLSYAKRSEIANLSTLYWAVEAVDNTGRSTRSATVESIHVDTTPTVPVAIFPEGEDEIRAEEAFRIEASSDPWPEDHLVYEIQVSGDGDFSKPLLYWRDLEMDQLLAQGIDGYADTRLMSDDQRYFWRVRAVDNHGAASEWSRVKAFWFNRRNGAPSTPSTEMMPDDGAVIREMPALSWGASSDPDHSDPPESLSYVIQIAPKADFSTQVREEQTKAVTRLDLSALIPDNSRWFWRVMARDNENASSEWSKPRSLVYNRVEDSPRGLALKSPAIGGPWVKLDHLMLDWIPAEDPDWNASLTYVWKLYDASNPARPLLADSTADVTSRKLSVALKSGNEYLLDFKVHDETGLEQALPQQRFLVDSHPVAPRLTSLMEEYGPADRLSWDASTDPDPDDRVLYRITLKDQAGRALVDVADWPGTEATLGKLYNADKLPDDSQLSWTVTAVDPHKLSATSTAHTFWFNSGNDAPSAPAWDASLSTEQELARLDPILPFVPGLDPDHSDRAELLHHEVQIALRQDFQGARTVRVAAGATSLSAVALPDNTRSWLRLRTLDDEGLASAWSAPVSLVINLMNEAPSSPVITQPAVGQACWDLSGIQLAFEASSDPDVDAVIEYEAVLESEAGEVLASLRMKELSARLTAELENEGRYRLRVRALDEDGLSSPVVERAFTVNTTPGAVTQSGRAGQIVGRDHELAWTQATDPDPADRLSYEIQLSSPGLAEPLLLKIDGLKLSLKKVELPENEAFSCRVRAVDPHNARGPWSEALSLVWNARNEAPVWQGELSPAEGFVRSNEATIRWQAPLDPDPGSAAADVEVQVAADAGFKDVLVTRRVTGGELSYQQNLRENEHRYLRARAIDAEGAGSDWSPVRHLVVNAREEAPSAAPFVSPANGSTHRPGEITVRWKEAQDADPESAKPAYRLSIDSSRGHEEMDLRSTQATLQLEAGDWTLSLVAVDDTGLSGASSTLQLKVVEPAPPAPEKE
jgi:hypothetical protein